MFLSVIICTYNRAAALEDLLQCLAAQTYPDFEVLIVDGSDQPSPVQKIAEKFRCVVIQSPRGLARQRNAGLLQATGDLICFFDDDVTFGDDFLEKAARLFQRKELQDVGGVTGYDELHYPSRLTWRWRLRWLLRIVPSLRPGDADHLGRTVPISFLQPCSGCQQVGWLAGFCMLYRRSAIQGLLFDEQLPTYGGEDRDFSFRVGRRSRLLLCGDLRLKHHGAPQGRASNLDRMYQTGFGSGRVFAKQARTVMDHCTIAYCLFGDFLVDLLVFAGHPSRYNFLAVFARVAGFLSGMKSWRAAISYQETAA